MEFEIKMPIKGGLMAPFFNALITTIECKKKLPPQDYRVFIEEFENLSADWTQERMNAFNNKFLYGFPMPITKGQERLLVVALVGLYDLKITDKMIWWLFEADENTSLPRG